MAEFDFERLPSAKTRYTKLSSKREPYLTRARECALVTIPHLMPPQGYSETTKLATPYQSHGARGVRTLGSKLLLSLFPSQFPFFVYRAPDTVLEEMGAKRGDFEIAMSRRERAVNSELNRIVFRPQAYNAILQLLIAGNAAMFVPRDPKKRAVTYKMDSYVVRRDNSGNMLEFVLLENIDFGSLPDFVQDALRVQQEYKDVSSTDLDDKPVELYTHVVWDGQGKMWRSYQEAGGIKIPDTFESYKQDELEWQVLTFSLNAGESYGRGYVEELLGDLDSLEGLSETLVEGSGAAAKLVFFVDPAGTTRLDVVEKASTGSVVSGRASDVTTLQAEKQADLNVAKAQAEEIASRLSYAFMMHSAVQRQGERVTAEEIRYMASELDSALGGAYTLLSADWQAPLVPRLERLMMKRNPKIAPMPDNTVDVVVTTGLEAIGRGHDQANLKSYISDVITPMTPENAMRYHNALEFYKRTAASYGIDPVGLILTQDEVDAADQRNQMMAMAQQAMPQLISSGGNLAGKAMPQQQQGRQ